MLVVVQFILKIIRRKSTVFDAIQYGSELGLSS